MEITNPYPLLVRGFFNFLLILILSFFRIFVFALALNLRICSCLIKGLPLFFRPISLGLQLSFICHFKLKFSMYLENFGLKFLSNQLLFKAATRVSKISLSKYPVYSGLVLTKFISI